MDYFLNDEQLMIKDLARKIANEKILPVREEYDEKGEFPWPIMKILADADLCGIYIEEEYGGLGGGCLELCLAIEELSRVLNNYPDYNPARRWLSVAYCQKGMIQEAMAAFSKVSTKGKDWLDGYIYGMAGETEKVRVVLEYHLEQSKIRFIKPTDFTVIYAALGEFDKALDYLEQAYEEREGWLVLLQVEPLYDNLRDEPRFQAILEKMNFPPDFAGLTN